MQQELQYINDYKVEIRLDKGAQGEVFLVSLDKQLYAAKVYKVSDNPTKQAILEQDYDQQACLLKDLKHQSLINLVKKDRDARVKIFSQGPDEVRRAVIIMEFAEKGVLIEYMMQKGRLSVPASKRVFTMILSAIAYMDTKCVAHRDIKPENTLINEDFQVKLGDFGHATISKDSEGYFDLKRQHGMPKRGTQIYCLPEMDLGKSYTGIQADVYSAGIILFVMMVGSFPYPSLAINDPYYQLIKKRNFKKYWQLVRKSRAVSDPSVLSKEFVDLMESILGGIGDKCIRPTVADLLANKWLSTDLGKDQDYTKQMSEIYQLLVTNNETKKAVERIKLQFFKKEIKDNKRSLDQRDSEEPGLMSYYNQYLTVSVQDIETLKTDEIANFVNQKPALLLAWVRNFLTQNFSCQQDLSLKQQGGKINEKRQPLNCLAGNVVPQLKSFKVDNETGQMNATLELQLNLGPEYDVTDIQIRGRIVKDRDSNQIAIKWENHQDESFYAGVIRKYIDQSVKVLQ